jgi:hypothetical protein
MAVNYANRSPQRALLRFGAPSNPLTSWQTVGWQNGCSYIVFVPARILLIQWGNTAIGATM